MTFSSRLKKPFDIFCSDDAMHRSVNFPSMIESFKKLYLVLQYHFRKKSETKITSAHFFLNFSTFFERIVYKSSNDLSPFFTSNIRNVFVLSVIFEIKLLIIRLVT